MNIAEKCPFTSGENLFQHLVLHVITVEWACDFPLGTRILFPVENLHVAYGHRTDNLSGIPQADSSVVLAGIHATYIAL